MMNDEHTNENNEGRLLEVDDLHIEARTSDGWTEIIKGISITLDRREILGLIGESGAGKSTLGLASMGYFRRGTRATSGHVIFDGTDLLRADVKTERRLLGARIAYVAQSAAAAFNPAHRIGRQVIESAVRHDLMSAGEAHKRALGLYQKLQLPNPDTFGQRYPHQVSGGQLQRAMMAMAMMCDPEMLVFDEPTTALDVSTQMEVLLAMKQAIADENLAALYITHDLAVVAQVADRINVLRTGETIEEGTTEQIIYDPRQEYTQQLVNMRQTRRRERRQNKDEIAFCLTDVSASYGRSHRQTPVLHDVHYAVQRGETAAIVGESGSGKSTLARVASGLLPPVSGTIQLNGKTLPALIKQRSREQLRRMQMIYQSPDMSLNPAQKIEEIIGRPITFYFGDRGSTRRRTVEQLLEQVELSSEIADRLPNELSGGQKQRICIARALAARPDVIICDEITSALDQLVGREILRLLQRLQEETGTSYIFITHDFATVRAIAHSVTVMQHGKVVEYGTTRDVLDRPTTDYTKQLLTSEPKMEIGWLEEATRQ